MKATYDPEVDILNIVLKEPQLRKATSQNRG